MSTSIFLLNNKNLYRINKYKRRFKWRHPSISFLNKNFIKPFRRKRWLHYKYLRTARRLLISQNKYQYDYVHFLTYVDVKSFHNKIFNIKQDLFLSVKQHLNLLKQYLLVKKPYLHFRLTKINIPYWFILNWFFKNAKKQYKKITFHRSKTTQKILKQFNDQKPQHAYFWKQSRYKLHNTKSDNQPYVLQEYFKNQQNGLNKKLFLNKTTKKHIIKIQSVIRQFLGFKQYTQIRWIRTFTWRSFWHRKQRRRIFFKKFFSYRKKIIFYYLPKTILVIFAALLKKVAVASTNQWIQSKFYFLYLKFKYSTNIKRTFLRIDRNNLRQLYNFCWKINKKQISKPLCHLLFSLQKILGYQSFKNYQFNQGIFNTLSMLISAIREKSLMPLSYDYYARLQRELDTAKKNIKYLQTQKYKKTLSTLLKLFLESINNRNKNNQNFSYLHVKKHKTKQLRQLLRTKRYCFKLNMFQVQKININLPFLKKWKKFKTQRKFNWFDQSKFLERKQRRYKYKRQSQLLTPYQYRDYKDYKYGVQNKKHKLLQTRYRKYFYNKNVYLKFKNINTARLVPKLLQNKRYFYSFFYNQKSSRTRYYANKSIFHTQTHKLPYLKKKYFFPRNYYRSIFFTPTNNIKNVTHSHFLKFKFNHFISQKYKKYLYYNKKKLLKQNKKYFFHYIKTNKAYKKLLKEKIFSNKKQQKILFTTRRYKLKRIKKNHRWKIKKLYRSKNFNQHFYYKKMQKIKTHLKSSSTFQKPLKVFLFQTLLQKQIQMLVKNPQQNLKYMDNFKEVFFSRWVFGVYNKKKDVELLYNFLIKRNTNFLNMFKTNSFIFIKQLKQNYFYKFYKYRSKIKQHQHKLKINKDILYKKILDHKYKQHSKKIFQLYISLEQLYSKLKTTNTRLYKWFSQINKKTSRTKKIFQLIANWEIYCKKLKKHKKLPPRKKIKLNKITAIIKKIYINQNSIETIKNMYKDSYNKTTTHMWYKKLNKITNLYNKLGNIRLYTRRYWLFLAKSFFSLKKFSKFERILSHNTVKMTRIKRQAFASGRTFYNIYKSFTNFFRYQIVSTKKRNYFNKKIFINFFLNQYNNHIPNKTLISHLLRILKINTKKNFLKQTKQTYPIRDLNKRLSWFYMHYRKRFNRYRSLQLYSKYRFNKRLFLNRHSRLRFGLTHFLRKWKRLQSIYAQKKFIVKFFLQQYYKGINPTEFYKLRNSIKYKNNKLTYWHSKIENRADIILSKLKLSSNLWLSRYLITSKKIFFDNKRQTKTNTVFRNTPLITLNTQPNINLFNTIWQNKTQSTKFTATPLNFYHQTNEVEQFLNFSLPNKLPNSINNKNLNSKTFLFKTYKSTVQKRAAHIHWKTPPLKRIRRLFYFKKNKIKKTYKNLKIKSQINCTNLTTDTIKKNWYHGAPKITLYRTRKNNKGLFANTIQHHKYRTNYINNWYINYIIKLQKQFTHLNQYSNISDFKIHFFSNHYILTKVNQNFNNINQFKIHNLYNNFISLFNTTKNITTGIAPINFNTWRRNFELKLHRHFKYRGRRRPRTLRTNFTKMRNNTLLTYDFLNFLRFNKI